MSFLLIDSHGHLDDKAFDEDRYLIAENFNRDGIAAFVNVSANRDSNFFGAELSEKYDNVFFSAGIHPSECGELDFGFLDTVKELYGRKKCVAIGEIGLDYHYDDVPRELQKKWFERQCALAKELDAPVIIHDREAHRESFETVKKYGNRGVFHCFSGSAEMAAELVKLGFYISFTGVLTFKNAKKTIEAAQAVPPDRLMIETDCPYMAPEPLRGTRNEPKNVLKTCEKLAEIKGITPEEAAAITVENTCRLFGIENIWKN